MSTLAFLEFPQQIDPALEALEAAGAYRLVPLTPHVEIALEARGLTHLTISSRLPDKSQEHLGFENFGKVERLCAAIDDFWKERFPYFRERELRPAWFNFFALKMLYDAVTLRFSEVVSILGDVRPERVLCFETQPVPFDEKLYWGSESVYTRVIVFACESRGIPVEFVQSGELTRPPRSTVVGCGMWRRRLMQTRWGQLARTLKELGAGAMLRLWLSKPGGGMTAQGRILFYGLEHNLSLIAAALLERGDTDVWAWNDGRPSPIGKPWLGMARPETVSFLPEARRRAWEVLRGHPDFRSVFQFEGMDWIGLVADRLQYLCLSAFGEIEGQAARDRALLERMKPDAIVFSSISDQRRKVLAHVARTLNIPVVFSPHGEMGTHFFPMNYYNDFVSANHCLAYGPGFDAYMDRHYPGLMTCESVGSPRLDELAKRALPRDSLCRKYGLAQARKIVMYVPTMLDGNFHYRSFRLPEDREYFRIQRRLVEEFSKHPAVQFVVKLPSRSAHPRSPINEFIRQSDITNCLVVENMSFGALLNLADAFVIDSASTTLLEMMLTDTPIYIFNDWFHWEPEALEALKQRAFLANNLETFCAALSNDLHTGKAFERRLTDRTFLQLYGLPYPGQAAKRAADALVSFVNDSETVGSEPRCMGEAYS